MVQDKLLVYLISALNEIPNRELPYHALVKQIRHMIKSRDESARVLSSNVKKAIDTGKDYGLLTEKDDTIKLLCKVKTSESIDDLTEAKNDKNQPEINDLDPDLCNYRRRGRRGRPRSTRSRSRSKSRSRRRRSAGRQRSRSRRRR